MAQVAFLLMAMGCTSGPSVETCVPGRSLECSCPGGGTGAQVCNSSGSYEQCSCEVAPDLGSADTGSVGPGLDGAVDPADASEGPLDAVLDASDDGDAGIIDPDASLLDGTVLDQGVAESRCELTLSATQLDFGLHPVARQAYHSVLARNIGTAVCTSVVASVVGDGAFALRGPASLAVGAGAEVEIEVSFTPGQEATFAADLELSVSGSTLVVNLHGRGGQPSIATLPGRLDFGIVPVGCRSVTQRVRLVNVGSTAITLSRVAPISPQNGSFSSATGATLPFQVGGGGETFADVTYVPQSEGIALGWLEIEHSEQPLHPIRIPLRAEGRTQSTGVVQTSTVGPIPSTPVVDILFVVDDSCSMEDEQAALGPQLDAFLTAAQAAGVDYQIGVTTTDVDNSNPTRRGGSYCPYNGGKRGGLVECDGYRFITNLTPNAGALFNRMVTALGSNGSGYEQGLEAAYLALSSPMLTGWNAGFFRPGASLGVVFVSDEEDFSTRSVNFYADFLTDAKGGDPVRAGAVIVLPTQNPSCSSGGASRGIRYAQTVDSVGGVALSICTANWGQTLSDLGADLFGANTLLRVALSSQPAIETIRVFVDGVEVPEANWSYGSRASNEIVFEASARPAEGSTVRIEYDVVCF